MNRAFGVDLPAFKGMLPGLAAALPERRFDIEELIAEGDAVVARYTSRDARREREDDLRARPDLLPAHDGKIVEDDPITTPDLAAELGPLLAPATA